MATKGVLIVCDVDGTLVDEVGVPYSGAEAIGSLVAEGNHLAYASARPLWAIESLEKELGTGTAVAALQGAHITVRAGIGSSSVTPIASAIVEELWQLGTSVGDVWTYSEDEWRVSADNAAAGLEAAIVGRSPDAVSSAPTAHPVLKVLIVCSQSAAQAASLGAAVRSLPVVARWSKPTYLEVIAREAPEDKGLRHVAAELDLPLDRVVALGDGENDREMLLGAGLAISFTTAHERAKDAAHVIVAAPGGGGLAEAATAIRRWIAP